MYQSQSDVFEVGSFSAVFVFSEVFRIPSFDRSEVFIDCDAFIEVLCHLEALGYLVSSVHTVVIQTLDQGSFVRKARELVVSLD